MTSYMPIIQYGEAMAAFAVILVCIVKHCGVPLTALDSKQIVMDFRTLVNVEKGMKPR